LAASTFAPESPWYLVRKGRLDAARHSLNRVNGKNQTSVDVDQKIAQMVLTNELEVAQLAGQSWFDIFKKTNGRRSELALSLSVARSPQSQLRSARPYGSSKSLAEPDSSAR
jgi:SP family general alpha glucoside:H+ symporter-like MFS transporter